MLQLPSVTLVMIDTKEHVLARMAVEDCMAKVKFGDVLIFTDRPSEFTSLNEKLLRIYTVPSWPTKLEFTLFRWSEVAPYLHTSHALFIEWDAWVWDESMWDDKFLDYDYIGPPWKYDVNQNVGGGGFCLVSTKLKQYLRDYLSPCPIISDDWLLCCEYRPQLEEKGFIWAPEDVAHQFAFEYYRPSTTSRHFGFHGVFNFNEVLSPERLEERTRLMVASTYVTNRESAENTVTNYEGAPWRRFKLKNAGLLDKLQKEKAELAMSKLQLPSVTLVMIETMSHRLGCMALEDCLDQADFGDVLIFTDRPLEFSSLTMSHNIIPRIQTVPNWSSKKEWCQFRWSEVAPHLRTAYALFVEWDAWIWDTSMWTDDFYKYDYVGAPWWHKDGLNVGNGGFSLISTKLKRYLRAKQWQFPCDVAYDDDLLCRKYRPELQARGFVWAPEKLAFQFAFECVRPSLTSRHFGFHSAQNFWAVLSPGRLEERARLMLESDYITNPKGVTWRGFMEKNADLVDRLLLEKGKMLVKPNLSNSKEP